VRLLCASNLHLGRSTYGVPERLGLDTARLSMTATWDAVVDLARAESVDAVVIAGDLIDRENRRFEPIGPIERGLTTLARHDIPVILVAGDEDIDPVRALVDTDAHGGITLLGRDGTWQTTTVTDGDGRSITIAGWSAPGRSVTSTPVNDLATAADVVVLHGTPEGQGRGFAPIPAARVGGSATLWVAGAPFEPSVETIDGTTLLVPGSTAPLSPVDVGTRGAWIADINGDGVKLRGVPLGTVRFDHVDVDLTGTADANDVETRIIEALQATLESAVETDTGSHLLAVCAHFTLYGRTPAYRSLPALLDDVQRTVDLQKQGVMLAITSVTNAAEPTIALDPLLERADPVGETARIIAALDSPEIGDMAAPYQDLLHRTATRLTGAHRSRVFAAISSDPDPDLEEARRLLRREAWATLDALVRQRGIDQDGGEA
jgi:hypothetical protein